MRDDLTQVGYVGLIKAVEHFDPSMGVPFEAYARPMIAGEITHYLRDQAPVIKPPRWYRALNTPACMRPVTTSSPPRCSASPPSTSSQIA